MQRNWLIYAKVLDMYLGGMPQKHIAVVLGVSKQRVSQMVHEAAQQLAYRIFWNIPRMYRKRTH
jgi:DNA-binding transcriptional regulator LsrR (DeoR family)